MTGFQFLSHKISFLATFRNLCSPACHLQLQHPSVSSLNHFSPALFSRHLTSTVPLMFSLLIYVITHKEKLRIPMSVASGSLPAVFRSIPLDVLRWFFTNKSDISKLSTKRYLDLQAFPLNGVKRIGGYSCTISTLRWVEVQNILRCGNLSWQQLLPMLPTSCRIRRRLLNFSL